MVVPSPVPLPEMLSRHILEASCLKADWYTLFDVINTRYLCLIVKNCGDLMSSISWLRAATQNMTHSVSEETLRRSVKDGNIASSPAVVFNFSLLPSPCWTVFILFLKLAPLADLFQLLGKKKVLALNCCIATLLLPAIQHPAALHETLCPCRPTLANVPAKHNVSHLLSFSWLTCKEFAGVCLFGLQGDYFRRRQHVSHMHIIFVTPVNKHLQTKNDVLNICTILRCFGRHWAISAYNLHVVSWLSLSFSRQLSHCASWKDRPIPLP